MAEDTTNENTTNDTEGTAAQEVPADTEGTTTEGDTLGEGGIKALHAERKARADAERAVIAREVVAELGLPVELAGRIQGDDRDAMMEDARVFAAIAKASEPSRPAPIGAVGNGNHAPLTTSELFSNAIKGVL